MLEPGFVGGLLQPFSEIAMLLPLAVGALFLGQHLGKQSGAQRPGRRERRGSLAATSTFALTLMVTLWVSLTDALPLPRVPWPSLAASALGGLAVALGRTWERPAVMLVAAVLGAGVGLAAQPPPAAASAAGTLSLPHFLGLLFGCLLPLLASAVLVQRLHWTWARVGVRILASWLTAASFIVLALVTSKG